ncbi:MAG: hypothetical protein HY720_01720 [Planctomycetes bacterium]|nr:hypothetical protein [Planctomycetota bacterium]
MRPAPHARSFWSLARHHHATAMSEPDRPANRLPSTEELLALARRVRVIADAAGRRVAVAGGLAMQIYGSPRLTKDVDLIADQAPPASADLRPARPLTFGGSVLETPEGIDVDWIVRSDEYEPLYDEALDAAVSAEGDLLVVRPHHLAAMKLAALLPKHYEDLMFLLGRPGLVDLDRAREVVHRLVGGKFARDQFDAALEEARWRATLE